MSPIEVLLIVGGVGYILARRLIGELLEIKRLLVLPLVLTVIGVTQLRHLGAITGATIAFATIGCLLSIGLGLVRGRTVHLGARDGQLWMRYRASSVGLWVLNIALKAAMIPFERMISARASDAAEHAILLSIGLGILAETAVVLLRAMRTEATVVWQKGEDGAPHQTSAGFEQARTWLNDRCNSTERPLISMAKRFERDW